MRDVPSFPLAPIMRALGYDAPDLRPNERVKQNCAWHEDNKPSASLSYYGFNCFGCGKTFDAIKLIREEENLGFTDAVARAAELTGTTTTTVSSESGWGSLLS